MSAINSLKWLVNDRKFRETMKRLQLGEELNNTDKEYILTCAIIFIKSYERDNRLTSYFELAYCIILFYSIRFKDYPPLIDLSINFGFFPITNFILENEKLNNNLNPLQLSNVEYRLKNFEKEGITQTLEQKKNNERVLTSNENEVSYVAPTSFGKSSLFLEIIKESSAKRVAIIIPTKSLLTQTYKSINREFKHRKVICHDEMYDGELDFIATLTQERALRLMKNMEVSFDLLIIDEAHKMFEFSSRSILLTRLIRRNRYRNKSSKNYYFSPLISNSENLLTEKNEMSKSAIKFNIKEPRFFALSSEGITYSYNRFMDTLFETGREPDYLSYINKYQKKNNFIFIKSPQKIEMFARDLSSNLSELDSKELEELAQTVAKNVHEDFYAVDLIKKGVIYMHGRLPDLIKEYLESKFREYSDLKFLIANTVILEGVNLPIDNLYVLNPYGLTTKDLINLVGRVNRLNEVFNKESGGLDKLLPPAHFIQCKYTDKRINVLNTLKKFKSQLSKDTINNPLLINFDFDGFKQKVEKESNPEKLTKALDQLKKIERIREKESFLVDDEEDGNIVKKSFLESNLDANYYDPELALSSLIYKSEILISDEDWFNKDTIDKVFEFFISGEEENIKDKMFLRLQNPKARNYYKKFVQSIHKLTLKEHINDVVKYFKAIKNNSSGRYFYVGFSYGEIAKPDQNQNSYVDLSKKTHKEQVNLAMVKIKMETDFLSYTINDHVALLKEINLISEEEYNLFIYGTTKKKNTDYTKLGFSAPLVRKLEKDRQLENIEIDQLGHIVISPEFKEYIARQDDLIKFEISKYLPV